MDKPRDWKLRATATHHGTMFGRTKTRCHRCDSIFFLQEQNRDCLELALIKQAASPAHTLCFLRHLVHSAGGSQIIYIDLKCSLNNCLRCIREIFNWAQSSSVLVLLWCKALLTASVQHIPCLQWHVRHVNRVAGWKKNTFICGPNQPTPVNPSASYHTCTRRKRPTELILAGRWLTVCTANTAARRPLCSATGGPSRHIQRTAGWVMKTDEEVVKRRTRWRSLSDGLWGLWVIARCQQEWGCQVHECVFFLKNCRSAEQRIVIWSRANVHAGLRNDKIKDKDVVYIERENIWGGWGSANRFIKCAIRARRGLAPRKHRSAVRLQTEMKCSFHC